MARKKDDTVSSVQSFIDKDAAEFLKKLAKNDFRSVAKYVQKLIMQDLEKNGYEPSDSTQKKTVSNELEVIEKVEQSAIENTSITEATAPATTTPKIGARTRNRNSKVAPMQL